MQSQYRALHYSVSRGKNSEFSLGAGFNEFNMPQFMLKNHVAHFYNATQRVDSSWFSKFRLD